MFDSSSGKTVLTYGRENNRRMEKLHCEELHN
jgi:hypothetical protein